MSMFNTSSPQHDRSLAEVKQWFPAFQILRWFDIHGLSTVFSPTDLLWPAVILACRKDLMEPLLIHPSSFSHSSLWWVLACSSDMREWMVTFISMAVYFCRYQVWIGNVQLRWKRNFYRSRWFICCFLLKKSKMNLSWVPEGWIPWSLTESFHWPRWPQDHILNELLWVTGSLNSALVGWKM